MTYISHKQTNMLSLQFNLIVRRMQFQILVIIQKSIEPYQIQGRERRNNEGSISAKCGHSVKCCATINGRKWNP